MIASAFVATLLAAAPTPASLEAMRWQRRVLVMSAPTSGDPALARQRRALDDWKTGAAERDISLVEIVGGTVVGVGEDAPALRRRLGLPADRFGVALIGKDGHVALRGDRPIPAATLETTIDAMPMRRAGGR